MLLPFDSHNHLQLGPSPAGMAIVGDGGVALSGMALMSTHPRDYSVVSQLAKHLTSEKTHVVPCFGVHPWFLHEVPEDAPSESSAWLFELEQQLLSYPQSIVGEIGLDGFHFDAETKELVSPMEKQVEAFELQMKLACKLQRPVSIHAVQAFGALMESLSSLKRAKAIPPKMYFHAFGGKLGTIDQILALCGRDYGRVYFGFAPIVST